MSQKYPDLMPLRLCKYEKAKYYTDVLVLYKNGTQYHLLEVGGKNTFHATEPKLEQMLEWAKVFNSPLMKALE